MTNAFLSRARLIARRTRGSTAVALLPIFAVTCRALGPKWSDPSVVLPRVLMLPVGISYEPSISPDSSALVSVDGSLMNWNSTVRALGRRFLSQYAPLRLMVSFSPGLQDAKEKGPEHMMPVFEVP